MRSRSPPRRASRKDSSSEGSETPSPPPVLPSLSSIAAGVRGPPPSSQRRPLPSSSSAQSQRLYPDVSMEDATGRMGRIALNSPRMREVVAVAADSEEERKKHALLIRDILVRINEEYRRTHGTPPPVGKRVRVRESERDVEMVPA